MTGDDGDPHSIRAALSLDVSEALPAIAAMAVVAVAIVVLDGWAVAVAVGCAVVGMFVAIAYRDHSSQGAERRRARERFDGGARPAARGPDTSTWRSVLAGHLPAGSYGALTPGGGQLKDR